MYDTVGMLLLLKACIQNLKNNTVIETYEKMEDYLTEEEVQFTKDLLDKVLYD